MERTARNLAQRAITSTSDDNHRLDFLAKRLLARPLSAEELAIVRGSLTKFEQHYTSHDEVPGRNRHASSGTITSDGSISAAPR